MRWILAATDDARSTEMGGKARALAALDRAALSIPDWFAISGDALNESLGEKGRQKLASAKTADEIRGALAGIRPAPAVMEEVNAALTWLLPEAGLVAVRSSANDEDGAQHSFAGQLESHLFVSRERVAENIVAVWRSGFSERIIAYRQQHGLSLVPRAPAVLVQRMVNADAAGVAFSADPVSGRRGVVVVSAVFGLGTALVSGETNADTWLVDRAGKLIETRLGEKNVAHRPAPDSLEGVRAETLATDAAHKPALTEDQVRAVAALARRCAAHFGRPQDIEWAIESGRLFLLQSRPITSLAALPDPDGVLNLWDNSNIAESYGGITTPLTYTFARRAYEEVYRQFCRLMAVPRARVAEHAQVFRCMIGLVRGRVYYNLLNWYHVLAMLPGFTVNRRFMEQMMGVKEGLPDELLRELQEASAADRFKDTLHLGATIAGLVWNHFTLPSRIREFYARLNHALRPPSPALDQMRPDELIAHYQNLERQLLTRWDAPLVNDFFAMIFYGLLRRLVAAWCGDTEGTLQNNLLCGEGGIISAEPARRVRELAEIAAVHRDFVTELTDAPLNKILRELDRVPEFAARYREYLDKFGDRCLDELKLESATLHDDPTSLLRSVGHLAKRLGAAHNTQRAERSIAESPLTPALSPSEGERENQPPVSAEPKAGETSADSGSRYKMHSLSPPHEPEASPLPSLSSPSDGEERVAAGRERSGSGVQCAMASAISLPEGEGQGDRKRDSRVTGGSGIEAPLREQAEACAGAALRGHWLRASVFRWVLKHTRARVRERENLRFERTRLFGRVRRIFVALGREFNARALLETPGDVFYLELEEVFGFCDGTTSTADLKGLVSLRRAEFARYGQTAAPADRFETRGPVHHGHNYQRAASEPAIASEGDLKGIGCCPGVVRGPVRVVTDPRNALLKPGEILVAERTDPGWIMLFASAAGLLVERGSLLSHSAIVSRELGIPSIVAIPGITRQLKDGDEVEMNGSTGTVKRVSSQPPIDEPAT